MARTLVAVGTPSEVSMFATTRAAGPRSFDVPASPRRWPLFVATSPT